jgi:hypothetical protein
MKRVEGDKRLDRIAERVVQQAEAGDDKAYREIGDRLDGKASQSVAVDGNVTVTLSQLIQQSMGE